MAGVNIYPFGPLLLFNWQHLTAQQSSHSGPNTNSESEEHQIKGGKIKCVLFLLSKTKKSG